MDSGCQAREPRIRGESTDPTPAADTAIHQDMDEDAVQKVPARAPGLAHAQLAAVARVGCDEEDHEGETSEEPWVAQVSKRVRHRVAVFAVERVLDRGQRDRAHHENGERVQEPVHGRTRAAIHQILEFTVTIRSRCATAKLETFVAPVPAPPAPADALRAGFWHARRDGCPGRVAAELQQRAGEVHRGSS